MSTSSKEMVVLVLVSGTSNWNIGMRGLALLRSGLDQCWGHSREMVVLVLVSGTSNWNVGMRGLVLFRSGLD